MESLIFVHQQLKNILKLTKKGKKGKIFIITGDFYPFEQFKLLKNPNFKEALIPPNLKNDEFSKKIYKKLVIFFNKNILNF